MEQGRSREGKKLKKGKSKFANEEPQAQVFFRKWNGVGKKTDPPYCAGTRGPRRPSQESYRLSWGKIRALRTDGKRVPGFIVQV